MWGFFGDHSGHQAMGFFGTIWGVFWYVRGFIFGTKRGGLVFTTVKTVYLRLELETLCTVPFSTISLCQFQSNINHPVQHSFAVETLILEPWPTLNQPSTVPTGEFSNFPRKVPILQNFGDLLILHSEVLQPCPKSDAPTTKNSTIITYNTGSIRRNDEPEGHQFVGHWLVPMCALSLVQYACICGCTGQ